MYNRFSGGFWPVTLIYLTTETDPVSEKLCSLFLEYRTMDKVP
jgi:hypothetical protein